MRYSNAALIHYHQGIYITSVKNSYMNMEKCKYCTYFMGSKQYGVFRYFYVIVASVPKRSSLKTSQICDSRSELNQPIVHPTVLGRMSSFPFQVNSKKRLQYDDDDDDDGNFTFICCNLLVIFCNYSI